MKNPENFLHNLKIKIYCPEMNFKNSLFKSAKDQIRDLGCAIDWAERNLSGRWRIREDGKLIQGFSDKVDDLWEGEIDAEKNMSQIMNLKDALEEDIREPLYDFPDIDFKGGGFHRFKVIGQRLYIAGFYESWKGKSVSSSLP